MKTFAEKDAEAKAAAASAELGAQTAKLETQNALQAVLAASEKIEPSVKFPGAKENRERVRALAVAGEVRLEDDTKCNDCPTQLVVAANIPHPSRFDCMGCGTAYGDIPAVTDEVGLSGIAEAPVKP